MNQSVEEMMATETTETSEAVDFDTQLHQSHALHTDGDWVHGRLTNVRVRPVLTLLAQVFETHPVSTTCHSVKDLSTYNSSTFTATEPEPPFIEECNQKAPYEKLYRDIIDYPTRVVESKEELFACDDTDTVTLIPTENDDCYLFAEVKFELVAELESEELLKPHTVSLETKRDITEFTSLSTHPILKETNSTKVKYKYDDDSLSIQYQRPNSKNWMKPGTVTTLYTIIVGVGLFQVWSTLTSFLQSTTVIPGLSSTVQSINPFSGILWSVFTLVSFVAVFYYGSKIARHFLPAIKNMIATGETKRRIDSRSEAVPTSCLYSKAVDYAEEQQRIKEKAERLKNELSSLPREVTVSPTDNGKKLTAESRSLSWTVGNENVLNETSIDFFIEYGFDGDMSSIETHMVQNEEDVPDHLPALKSTNGNWYLLPEKIQTDPIISI